MTEPYTEQNDQAAPAVDYPALSAEPRWVSKMRQLVRAIEVEKTGNIKVH